MRNVNMTADEPDPAARPTHAADTGPTGPAPGSVTAEAESAADQAVTALYATHYRPLVRLATLLVGDADTAAEVAEDAFVAMHGAWRWLRDRDKALSYLRQSVVKGSRSALRHAAVADPKTPERAVAMPGGRPGSDHTRTLDGDLSPARPPTETAGSGRAQVLPGSLRRAGRIRDGDRPGCGAEPHGPGHGGPAGRPEALRRENSAQCPGRWGTTVPVQPIPVPQRMPAASS